MGMISKLFGSKENPLAEQARKLIGAASVFSVSLFEPTLKRFVVLEDVDVRRWDFIVTVAGVFISATRLNNLQAGTLREEKLMEIVSAQLDSWDKDGLRAFEDCKRLFEIEYDRLRATPVYQQDPRFLASDALGIWIVWNVLCRRPETMEEIELVRAVGGAVTHAFFDWWEE